MDPFIITRISKTYEFSNSICKKSSAKLVRSALLPTNLNPMKKLLLNLMSHLLIQVNWIIPLVR